MDKMSNYVASGWKRDLTHIISCCWVAQVGPLDSEEWEVAIRKFLAVMRNRRAVEWTDIKELTPLQLPYMADLFRPVGHRQGPTRPQQVHEMDRAWGLLPLESGPVRPAPCLPSPPRAASA